MNIESGHTYRDVAGRMRGPMVFRPDLSLLHGVYSALGSPCHFRDDGTPAVTPGDRTNDWPSYRLVEVLTPSGWVNPDRNPLCVAQELTDEAILGAASGQQKAEPAWKQDGGKPRLDLIAPELLFGTAEVLTYGVEKYSKKVENEWHALLLAEHVESLRLLTPEGCVVVVTKSTCGRPILSLQSASDKIDENGKPETLTECGNWPSVEKMILRLAPGTKRQNGALRSASMDWTNRDTKPCAPQGAPYAGPNVTCTLTIATKRGDFEVSFAPDAITGLDFWATVWGDLNARFGILKPQSQTGARNWERGMSWGRVFGALMRHMWAWWGGAGPSRTNFIFGEADEETGFSHLWHAACCLMFLITYEQRKIGTDDRKNPVDNS